MACRTAALLALLMIPVLAQGASAHTVDAVGQYRLEIGWMNEPVISGDTNGIELHISQLVPCAGIDEPMECAASQGFGDGIGGLEKNLKIQLVLKDDKITLPVMADHNMPGKYHAFVNPTVSGFYQANLLGDIRGTALSLSMHPPKVQERAYIEFPGNADSDAGHGNQTDEIEPARIESANIGYAGIALGVSGIIVASVAVARTARIRPR